MRRSLPKIRNIHVGDLFGVDRAGDVRADAEARRVGVGQDDHAVFLRERADVGELFPVAEDVEPVGRHDRRVDERRELRLIVFSLDDHRLL